LEPLLYLVHRLPYPPNKGDRIRSFHLLRYLSRNYRVHLGAFVDAPAEARQDEVLGSMCAEVFTARLHPRWARLRSLTGLLRGEALTVPYYRDARMQRWVDATVRANSIRRAVVFSSPMVQYAAAVPGLRLVADLCDVDSAKWTEYAPRHRWPLSAIYRREGRRLLAFERACALHCHACTFVTPAERELFARLAPESAARAHAVGSGVDPEFFLPLAGRPSPYAPGEAPLVFTGAMDYWPNIDAVGWFAREVLPRLVAARPGLRFFIVGMNPAAEVRALAADPAVVVTGKVKDVRPYLQHAAVVVAPLRVARGIQYKVIEAMTMGRPVVVSESAARGLSVVAGRDFVCAPEQPAAFADAVLELLQRPDREELGARGRAAVGTVYDSERTLAAFGRLLEEPEAAGAPP
jgi:sugar transferase (PEP-CTERM/EpsH1 system associated)